MNLREKVERGERAGRLLRDPLLTEVFKKYYDEITERWRASTDAAERERLWWEQEAANQLIARLSRVAQDGRFAEDQINEQSAEP